MKIIIWMVVFNLMCAFSQNLLHNPNFETWNAGLPDYWYRDESIYVYQEVQYVYSGNFSVRDSLISPFQSAADFYQGYIPVQSNTRYDFSVWVYDNDPAGRLRLGVQWFPSGSEWATMYSSDSSDWQQLSMNLMSPQDAESVLVMIRAYDVAAHWTGQAVFYIDDALFQASTSQPPVIMRIWHMPINPDAGVEINVYARVSDNGSIIADTLYYGRNNLSNPVGLSHTIIANDTFQYQIPAQAAGDTIFYYLRFIDDQGLIAVSDTNSLLVGETGVFLNEILYDTEGSDSLCYIEIYGIANKNLDYYTLVGVKGSNGEPYGTIELTGYSIPPDGFFVVAQDSGVENYDLINTNANLHNGPDNIELRFHNITVDALGYGPDNNGWFFCGEWRPAGDVAAGHCLGRYPDGFDTDNNVLDFYDYTVRTPGAPNPAVGCRDDNQLAFHRPLIPYPVTNNFLFSRLGLGQRVFPVVVYNALGQLITTISQASEHFDLPAGIYFLKFNNEKKKYYKIVIIK